MYNFKGNTDSGLNGGIVTLSSCYAKNLSPIFSGLKETRYFFSRCDFWNITAQSNTMTTRSLSAYRLLTLADYYTKARQLPDNHYYYISNYWSQWNNAKKKFIIKSQTRWLNKITSWSWLFSYSPKHFSTEPNWLSFSSSYVTKTESAAQSANQQTSRQTDRQTDHVITVMQHTFRATVAQKTLIKVIYHPLLRLRSSSTKKNVKKLSINGDDVIELKCRLVAVLRRKYYYINEPYLQ